MNLIANNKVLNYSEFSQLQDMFGKVDGDCLLSDYKSQIGCILEQYYKNTTQMVCVDLATWQDKTKIPEHALDAKYVFYDLYYLPTEQTETGYKWSARFFIKAFGLEIPNTTITYYQIRFVFDKPILSSVFMEESLDKKQNEAEPYSGKELVYFYTVPRSAVVNEVFAHKDKFHVVCNVAEKFLQEDFIHWITRVMFVDQDYNFSREEELYQYANHIKETDVEPNRFFWIYT